MPAPIMAIFNVFSLYELGSISASIQLIITHTLVVALMVPKQIWLNTDLWGALGG